MGAWGAGSFENDAALDWAGSVESLGDVRGPFERLEEVKGGAVDSDLASEVIAAAETIAMLMGRRSRDFPDDLARRLADAGEQEAAVYHQARGAVLHVMRNSDLADLWEEAAAESGTNIWLAELTGLIDRLNPDVEAVPWEPAEIEQRVGQVRQTCAFLRSAGGPRRTVPDDAVRRVQQSELRPRAVAAPRLPQRANAPQARDREPEVRPGKHAGSGQALEDRGALADR